MVQKDWIEQKIKQLETDRLNNVWTDIRERQITYLKTIYTTQAFTRYSPDDITEHLILIFHEF